MTRSRFGGMTCTRLGSTAIWSVASTTGIFVLRCRISVSTLAWLGSRCWMSTKPIPLSARHVVQEGLEGLETAGRGAEADDRELRPGLPAG